MFSNILILTPEAFWGETFYGNKLSIVKSEFWCRPKEKVYCEIEILSIQSYDLVNWAANIQPLVALETLFQENAWFFLFQGKCYVCAYNMKDH